MAAKYWLSSEAISLTLDDVSKLGDEAARQFLAELRWGQPNQQACPHCGAIDSHYNIRSQKRWRCKHCFDSFSLTSGTLFDNMKIGPRKLLMAIVAFVINQKGLAALALRRIIGGQYRTAYTLLHKIRESMMITAAASQKFSGMIEIDGGHFSGVPRKGRKKADNTDKKDIPKK